VHDINAIDDIRMQETGDAQDVMEIEVQGKEVRFFCFTFRGSDPN